MTILQIFSVMDHLGGMVYYLGSCWLTFCRDRHPFGQSLSLSDTGARTPAYDLSPLRANHNSRLYTLHSTLYTLHFTLYTLHFKNSKLKSNQRGAL